MVHEIKTKPQSVFRKGFKFSQNTIANLKELVARGYVRNETEAIDFAVQHFLTEKKTQDSMGVPVVPAEAQQS